MNTFTITHDRLREGEFPIQQLQEDGIHVIVKKLPKFKEEVTIILPDNEEDLLGLAYAVGTLVQSYVMTRHL